MAVSVGIDAGMETAKIVILRDGKILHGSTVPLGVRSVSAVAKRLLAQAAEATGISVDELHCIGGTGTNASAILGFDKFPGFNDG